MGCSQQQGHSVCLWGRRSKLLCPHTKRCPALHLWRPVKINLHPSSPSSCGPNDHRDTGPPQLPSSPPGALELLSVSRILRCFEFCLNSVSGDDFHLSLPGSPHGNRCHCVPSTVPRRRAKLASLEALSTAPTSSL